MQSVVPFVLIIPGQGPITNFNCDNDIFHMDIINPGEVSSICVSLSQALPQNFAIGVYFTQNPYTQMQYLGAVSNNRPSDIFQTGFPLRQELASLQSVKLCLKPQHFNELADLVLVNDGKKQYTKLVGQNLYNFMMSYNKQGLLQHGIKGDYLVIPSDFLGKWLHKFQQKYTKDPNFILKTTTN